MRILTIIINKKSDSPNEDKCAHDSKLLIPTLKDFFAKYPLIKPKTFLGDAAFDIVQLYKILLSGVTFGENRHFLKAYIPLNARSHLENVDYTINENKIPCCPHDPALPMKYEDISKLRSGVPRYKFVCVKYHGHMTKPLIKITENVFVKIHHRKYIHSLKPLIA